MTGHELNTGNLMWSIYSIKYVRNVQREDVVKILSKSLGQQRLPLWQEEQQMLLNISNL